MNADDRPKVADSASFRRVGAAEALGARLGRLVPDGAVRRRLKDAYHALLGGAGKGVASTLPGGETVRVLPAYRFVTWNAAEYAAFRAAVRPGDTVLDVGANVGAYAMLFGRWVQPGGRVLAFEPSPEAHAGLVAHLRLNGLAGVVEARAEAVAGESGTLRFRSEGLHGTSRLADGASSIDVPAVSVDDLCAREGIDPALLKVDVEGAELDVLRGARETIARRGHALALFVEMHPTTWREMGLEAAEIRAELDRQHLRAVPLRDVPDPWALEGECLRLVPR